MSESTSNDQEPAGQPVGSLLSLKTKTAVVVTRPNGVTGTVLPVAGVAQYVLDVPGDFALLVDGKARKVTAH